ncbi:MAG: MFS transporter [Candidatus Caldarchaeum sp.]
MRKALAVLLLTWLSWFWSHGTRVGISAITPFLRQRFSISTAEAAAIPGVLNLGFYSFTFVSGKIPAKTGFRNTVMLSALGAGVATVAAGLLDNVYIFYCAIFLVGIFLSLHLPSAVPWLGQLFKGVRQGFFIGVHESAAPAGQTLGPIILAFLFTAFAYMFSFWAWASIPILAGLALLSLTKPESGDHRLSSKTLLEESVRIRLAPLTVLTIANLVGNLGVVAIVPLHLVDTFNLDKAYVAMIVGGSRLLGVVGQPLGGYLFDKHGFFRVASTVTILNLLSNMYLMLAPYSFVYPFMMAVQAAATAMYFPVVYSYLVRNLGPSASQVLGKVFSIAGLAGPTTAPILAGFLAQKFSYTVALAYPALLALAGTLSLLYLSRERRDRNLFL